MPERSERVKSLMSSLKFYGFCLLGQTGTMAHIDIATRSENVRSTFAGAAGAFVIILYFLQPLLPYANASQLWTGGLAMGVGIMLLHWTLVTSESPKVTWVDMAGGGTFLYGVVVLGVALTTATSRLDVNEARCIRIDKELMRGEPRRGDLADLYQAFSCRPNLSRMPLLPGTRGKQD